MTVFLWIGSIAVMGVAGLVDVRNRKAGASGSLADSASDARRWVERLGGQIYSLYAADNTAARQALADAAERFTAAGAQVDQASSERQFRLARQTVYEGLYYVSAARTALGLDPGPAVPPIPGQQRAGAVAEDRSVIVEDRQYSVSPFPGEHTASYYPGGLVAGRPVPRGWYSEPWWQSAIDAGTWSVGSYLIASSLLSDISGGRWNSGYGAFDNPDQDAGSDGLDGNPDGDYAARDSGGDEGDY